MAQMGEARGKRAQRSGAGNFAAEAATSVKAPKAFEDCPTRFSVGDRVLYKDKEHVVIYDGGYVGLDGRHWVQIERPLTTDGVWKAHVTCGSLQRL